MEERGSRRGWGRCLVLPTCLQATDGLVFALWLVALGDDRGDVAACCRVAMLSLHLVCPEAGWRRDREAACRQKWRSRAVECALDGAIRCEAS